MCMLSHLEIKIYLHSSFTSQSTDICENMSFRKHIHNLFLNKIYCHKRFKNIVVPWMRDEILQYIY